MENCLRTTLKGAPQNILWNVKYICQVYLHVKTLEAVQLQDISFYRIFLYCWLTFVKTEKLCSKNKNQL